MSRGAGHLGRMRRPRLTILPGPDNIVVDGAESRPRRRPLIRVTLDALAAENRALAAENMRLRADVAAAEKRAAVFRDAIVEACLPMPAGPGE